MKSFRSGQFTPLIPLLPLPQTEYRIRSFEFWAFTPNPSAQNPKQKKQIYDY